MLCKQRNLTQAIHLILPHESSPTQRIYATLILACNPEELPRLCAWSMMVFIRTPSSPPNSLDLAQQISVRLSDWIEFFSASMIASFKVVGLNFGEHPLDQSDGSVI